MFKFKKVTAFLAALAMAALPFAGSAASTVQIESRVNVRNTTTNTNYAKATSAKVDDVVAVEVWYHNREDANSGKIANNLKVKIDVPSAAGASQTITSHVSAANSNSVTDTAKVNLSLASANLEYIPGSAQWRHNIGTNASPKWVTTKLGTAGDAIVNGNGMVLENEKPCFNFEATVTILVRVRASVFGVTKLVRPDGVGSYVPEINAKPGDVVQYVITFNNAGNTLLKDIIVRDNMPPYMTLVPGSTKLVNSATGTGGLVLPDTITTGGVTGGSLTPGGVGRVYLKLKIADSIPAGPHRLTNVGVVHPTGLNELYNTAVVNVNIATTVSVPPVTPTPLPATGMEGTAAAALGTGAVGYTVQAYRRSKRALLDALKRQ